MTFVGSYFQPYMAFDTVTRDKFEIKEVTGADKWDITELVSNTTPNVNFTIKNPNKIYCKFTTSIYIINLNSFHNC